MPLKFHTQKLRSLGKLLPVCIPLNCPFCIFTASQFPFTLPHIYLGSSKLLPVCIPLNCPFLHFHRPSISSFAASWLLTPNPRRATNKQLLLPRESWTIEWNTKIKTWSTGNCFFPLFLQGSIPFSARCCTGYLAGALREGVIREITS